MAYATLLEREEWHCRRKQILHRDNNKCQGSKCEGNYSRLEVHHIEYLSKDQEPWFYPDDMLISLCNKCHRKEQLRYKFEESLMSAFKMKGFLQPDISALTALLYSDETFSTDLLTRLRQMQNG